ncbi:MULTISPECIES: immunity 8 family protein [Providencia]|uniref:Uncharacterized protein n=2 Tax=Providencia rustigianii TaxID=158850 RepID=D1P410_9GAMM|nr:MULTISPECIES: immunity 8 family protein [Providencia]EFB71636.1 hypothetical protein PROVRUST_06961 [Providencia rustigianii DSM 4541]MTC55344.1 hypothetical protein [Providencia rustigianii]SUC27948.1 Uncharacterised protein [Providencia rustigianii]SUC36319.1 Uncharacterised protein [Providencia rustigianii]
MNIKLKSLRSLELEDSLVCYWPDNPKNFGSWVRTMIGPENHEGAESFDWFICTPNWLQQELIKNNVLFGKGMIIVAEYDYDQILTQLEQKIRLCDDSDWSKASLKLSRFSFWEYEDYQG